MEQTIHRAPGAEDRALAVRKLDEALRRGMGRATTVVERVMSTLPHDAIVRASAATFTASDTALTMHVGADNRWTFHPHAFGQVAEVCASKGTAYLAALREGEPWQRTMLANILTETLHHSTSRHLVRAVGGDGNGVREARGFLSDKYKRIDSRPVVEAFIQGARALGGEPYDASGMDTRHNIKFIRTDIREPAPGEYVAFGVEQSSGDFGGVAHQIRRFVVRLWCLNGATVEDLCRAVHLGSRLSDEIAFSDRTMQLDTAALVSATEDVVKASLAPANIDAECARIGAAAAKHVDVKRAFGPLAASLTKAELERAQEAFSGPDVVNLPEAPTVWRASNVLSLMAQRSDLAPERREDFERYAGALLKAAA